MIDCFAKRDDNHANIHQYIMLQLNMFLNLFKLMQPPLIQVAASYSENGIESHKGISRNFEAFTVSLSCVCRFHW